MTGGTSAGKSRGSTQPRLNVRVAQRSKPIQARNKHHKEKNYRIKIHFQAKTSGFSHPIPDMGGLMHQDENHTSGLDNGFIDGMRGGVKFLIVAKSSSVG